jgi:hypothetical protein
MTVPTTEPRIVRNIALLDRARHDTLGATGVVNLEIATEAKARAMAETIGITRPFVMRSWDLHVTNALADYPMYLLGPDAPRIQTAADVFNHVWHLENPIAQFTVTVRCQDELDEADRRWWERNVAKARDLIAQHGREAGLAAFQRDGNWAENVMSELVARLEARV